MARTKLKKFALIHHSSLFIPQQDYAEGAKLTTKKVFGNNNPVVLELGAGYGEYAVGLASRNLDKNYIAIDIKSDRLWKGVSWATQQGLSNVRFLRNDIYRVDEMFEAQSVSDIWLTFSDPQPHKPKKRLTHERFLIRYAQIQTPGSKIYIKTDSDLLYESTLESVERFNQNKERSMKYELVLKTAQATDEQTGGIITRYEKKFREQGYSIKFIALKLVI